MRKITIMSASFLIVATSGAALADDDCHVPMNQWQPRDAVMRLADSLGWTVRRIKTDDGCYEIKGIDEYGRGFKAKVDPGSLAIVKIKRKGDDNDKGRRFQQKSNRRDAAPPSSQSSTPPANGLFKGGEAPRVQVR